MWSFPAESKISPNWSPELVRLMRFKHTLLRRPTPAECRMKGILRSLKLRFTEQQVCKPYICDFYINKSFRCVIEVDGDSHDSKIEYDEVRANYLISRNRLVFRYTNEAVLKYPETVKEQLISDLGLI